LPRGYSLSNKYGYKVVFKAISELTDKERELIKEVKRTDVCSTIKGLLKSKLTA
jgi:CRISPR/Cas system CMR-associated protein Cmr1 (group 7 of RAMP superfamily)